MTGLPPPEGRPRTMWPRPDPWVEQARRRERHEAERRRRRWRRLRSVLVGAALLVGVVGAVVLAPARNGSFDGRSALAPGPTASTNVTPAPVTTTVSAPTTIPAERLVRVDEAWLIDRGDGAVDWGVLVSSPPGAPRRSGVRIDVRFLDEDDSVIDSKSQTVPVVGTDVPGGVAGRLADLVRVPVRIEYDVEIIDPTRASAPGEVVRIRTLARETDGTVDELTGRVRSSAPDELSDIAVLFVWRDDDGEVAGSVVEPIDRLRAGVDARFVIDLSDEVVPEGRPDGVVMIR